MIQLDFRPRTGCHSCRQPKDDNAQSVSTDHQTFASSADFSTSAFGTGVIDITFMRENWISKLALGAVHVLVRMIYQCICHEMHSPYRAIPTNQLPAPVLKVEFRALEKICIFTYSHCGSQSPRTQVTKHTTSQQRKQVPFRVKIYQLHGFILPPCLHRKCCMTL